MFMGNYFERTRERKKFRVNTFPNMEEKLYFLHCLALSSKLFLHILPGIIEKHVNKKQFDHGLKKWRARRAKCEVLNSHSNVHFPREVPIFKTGKNAKFALQHPIIFGVLVSPWIILKAEKRKFAFSWEMKSVSGHLKLSESVSRNDSERKMFLVQAAFLRKFLIFIRYSTYCIQ